jgi:hypothetical protein
MNELIKQAAEAYCRKTGVVMPQHYTDFVTHFLSFAKDNWFELVRTNGILYDDEVVKDMLAKERERMGKAMEIVGKIGDWTYNRDSKKWMMLHGTEESVWTYVFKTTSELIEIFNTQNKEG